MCGLVGYYTKKNNLPEYTINDMMNSIIHRGPDESNSKVIDNFHTGHVRLSIIDLEHGKQPMTCPNDRYTLVFNGEIYNYIELRQQLISKGYRLSTYSDTEVLLNMFLEYREKMLDHINGMFAFVIYDKVERKIFAARDHFGIKPLYYYSDEHNFVFGSEIKALLKHPAVKAAVSTANLHEYLNFQFISGDQTLFKNILKLEPATYMVVEENKIVEKKEYWQLDYTIDDSKTKEQYCDELMLLLDHSLSMQIRSDVPVGAYLSGGLDSSIVTTLASKHYFGNLKTFSGGFKESKVYDETHYARMVSKSVNSEHHEIFPTFNDFADTFEKLIYHMDEPAAGPGLFSQYMVSKLASQKVKVMLGGQGGDEVFGGYARYSVAYLEQCVKGAVFETQEEGQHVVTLSSIISHLPMLKEYVPMIKKQFASGLFEEMDSRYFRLINRSLKLNEIYDAGFLDNMNHKAIFQKFSGIFNHPDTHSYFNKMTHFDIKTLLPALLQVEDRVSMALSIESRVPLLDKKIVELAAKMPPTMKFAGGKTKYMLNQAVRNILPPEITQRKDKMGFPTPINEWLSGPLREFALDILTSKQARERGIFDVKNIEHQINVSSKFSRDLWGALCIETWFRKFID